MLRRMVLLALSATLLAGCASSKINATPMLSTKPAVHVIAFAPGGGLMSDAVGVELSSRGFTVIDTHATSGLLAQLNLTEADVARTDGLGKLKDRGVDAYLVVRAIGGYDQMPQSASARLVSTVDGSLVAGINWQNGFAGLRGSMADRLQRDGLTEAAKQIADAIQARLAP